MEIPRSFYTVTHIPVLFIIEPRQHIVQVLLRSGRQVKRCQFHLIVVNIHLAEDIPVPHRLPFGYPLIRSRHISKRREPVGPDGQSVGHNGPVVKVDHPVRLAAGLAGYVRRKLLGYPYFTVYIALYYIVPAGYIDEPPAHIRGILAYTIAVVIPVITDFIIDPV